MHGTTITAGMNNVFDLDPPFSFGAVTVMAGNAPENRYDESTFTVKGRF